MTTRKSFFSSACAATRAERADEPLQSYDASLTHSHSAPQCQYWAAEAYL